MIELPYGLTFRELTEIVRPMLITQDFHDIVNNLGGMTELRRALLLEMNDPQGERVKTFNEMARKQGVSVSAIRGRYEAGMRQVLGAMRGIALHMDGGYPAWTTLPTKLLKLVNGHEYSKRLSEEGKKKERFEKLESEIEIERAKIRESRKRIKELEKQMYA